MLISWKAYNDKGCELVQCPNAGDVEEFSFEEVVREIASEIPGTVRVVFDIAV